MCFCVRFKLSICDSQSRCLSAQSFLLFPAAFILGLKVSGKGPASTNVCFLLPTHFFFPSFHFPLLLSFVSPVSFYPLQLLLRSTVPCCSYQFERMFDSCRIPGSLTGRLEIPIYGVLHHNKCLFSETLSQIYPSEFLWPIYNLKKV